MTDVANELLREKLLALTGAQLPDVDVIRVLYELLNGGGGVTLELDELRLRLIRREGRFILLKKDDPRRSSSYPPRNTRRSSADQER